MPEYIAKFDGTDHRFLSNFYRAPITFEGKTYPTSEHAYQAAKTIDDSEKEQIRADESPAAAKKMGRKVTLRPDWEQVKDSIMLEIVRIKFNSRSDLAGRLLATGEKFLVEGNTWHDCHFGVCMCEKCNGKGKNVLGEILMTVRLELKTLKEAEQKKDQKFVNSNDIELEKI
jgi:ribA/ribD-fused uncharacterized protein